MTPYAFGWKLAAELGIRPAPPVPKAPSAGQQTPPAAPSRGWTLGGKPLTINHPGDWTRVPNPSQPNPSQARPPRPVQAPAPYKPQPVNPEHQQILGNLKQQYPQFGQGDLQDMLSLHIQGRGGELAQFIRNTQQKYKSQPAIQPPMQ